MPAFELPTQSLERTVRPASDDSKSRAPSATQSRIQPGLRPYGDRASWVPSVAQSVLSPPTRGQDPIDLDQLLEQPTSVGHILYPLTQNSLQPRIALDPPPIGPHALGKYKDPSSDTAPRRGRVVVRFVPANSNEIQLEVNDIVTILSEYWIGINRFFYGRCDSTSGHQRNGFFPRSHVLLLDDSSASNSALWSEPLQRAPHSPSISGEVYCGADCFIRQIARFALHVSTLHPAKLLVECPDFWTPTTISTIFPTKLRPWQTRLIHLKPGSEESDLECDLLVVDLIDGQGCVITDSSTTVQYEALSYSWGEASIRSSSPAYQHMAHITVNGTNWAISTDLANALLHVRSKQDGRYLWCDALCINQHDSDEKAAQIKGMLRIFEKAKNVIAWLGVAHPSSGRLIRAFEVMSPHIDLLAQRHTVACSNILDGIKAAMISHVSNSWFSRTWVRQEVFAAKQLTLCMGGHELSFELFTRHFDAVSRMCSRYRSSSPASIARPESLNVLQQEFQHFGTDHFSFVPPSRQVAFSEHWLQILSRGPLFGVTEERDRVYGALGILTSAVMKQFARLPGSIDGLIAQFPVSYDEEKSLGEVYGDVTKFLINFTGTASALDLWRIPNPKRRHCEKLASWATDWGVFDGQILPNVLSRVHNYNRVGMVGQPQQLYNSKTSLELRGVRLTSAFHQVRTLSTKSLVTDKYLTSEALLRRGLINGTEDALTIWIEETGGLFSVHAMKINLHEVSEVARGIQQGHYCLAETSFSLGGREHIGTFLVARNSQLDDIIVSFYGSQYLHLLRANTTDDNLTYSYLGPVILLEDGSVPFGATFCLQSGDKYRYVDASADWTFKPKVEKFILT